MIKLDYPVSSIPKIGPKYKTLLEKLEIHTVRDLLYHFPFRYDDYSKLKVVKDVQEGDIVTVEGILGEVKNIFTRGRKRITRATIVDYTGELPIIWFNQHFLARTLKKGSWYRISGKIGTFSNKLTFIAPDFELGDTKGINTGRLVPIYPETAGVSSKWLRSRINDVINLGIGFDEFLPEKTLEKHKLNNLNWAIKQIHFPDGDTESKIARKRFAFEELFLELLKVEKRKFDWSEKLKGHVFKPYSPEITTFIESLPFKLTKSQEISIQQIIEDMQREHPMNRLLEGDVGTGKTMVAILAAYLAHLNGFKTLYMAPTEILANQHFSTFSKNFSDTNSNTPIIGLKTGSNKLDTEDWDILIGTHALLFSEEFTNIGLVVIDEQHRFGVEQRGKLVEMGKKNIVPHLLTMTATPIPRTLALTIYGDLAISALTEHPNKKREVVTKVIAEKQRKEAYEWIKEKGEPTFIVCPLIEESAHETMENVKAAEAEYKSLKESVFKGIDIGLLHGRMKAKEKEKVVDQFRKGKIKVLVSTPVIEVGIDIPDATVIVIESAERYGLASLHQLRGRVGRGEKNGFCFVFMSNNSRNAHSRLKNLEKVTNGLELAEIDMELRGKGDVFGTMQHGWKKFKIAHLDDLQLLQKAKLEAQEVFPELDRYPNLKQTLDTLFGVFVSKN